MLGGPAFSLYTASEQDGDTYFTIGLALNLSISSAYKLSDEFEMILRIYLNSNSSF